MITNFSEWWDKLVTMEQIYWCIAGPFTLIFLFQLVLTFIGGGDFEDGGNVDADIDSDGGIGFQFLTLKNLIAFFAIFGWVGLATLDAGLSNVWSVLISTFSGLFMMAIMASIFYFLSRMQESGTMNIQDAIGATGEVYMELKKERGNIGKIQVNVGGTLRTLEAMTDDSSELSQGAVVDVTKVVNNNILLVTKSKA